MRGLQLAAPLLVAALVLGHARAGAEVRVFVTNEKSDNVTVIDAATRKVIQSIPVGKRPRGVAVSPYGRRDDVHLIETASDTVVKQIPVPRNPRGMRFTADSRFLFVASEQAHVVSVVDMAQLSVIKSVPTGGSRPVDVAFTLDGSRAYVSHGQSGDVRVLDTVSLRVLAAIPVGPRTWWTALTPDGRFLWATVGRPNEVAVIDTQSNTVVARVPCGTLPWGIAIANVP